MKKWITLILLLALVVLGILFYWRFSNSPEERPHIEEARIQAIQSLIELSTLEVVEEVSLKDTIHGKGLFAIGTLRGNVHLNLDKLQYHESGDTLFVQLPPEEISLYESTETDSYRIVDIWSNSLFSFSSPTLSTQEENTLKQRWISRERQSFYDRGYVAQARRSAMESLAKLFATWEGKVVIQDPYPQGYLSEQYRE